MCYTSVLCILLKPVSWWQPSQLWSRWQSKITLCSNSLVGFSLTGYSQSFIIGIIMSHIVRAYVSTLPAFTQPSTLPYGGKILKRGFINNRKILLSPVGMLLAAPSRPPSSRSWFYVPVCVSATRLCSPSASADFESPSMWDWLLQFCLYSSLIGMCVVLFTSWAERS